MTPPVQPESELQKIEAIPAEILAWLKHIATSIGILHAATPNAAPLPAPPTSTPADVSTVGNDPTVAVELTPEMALANGQATNSNLHYWLYLRSLDPVELAQWCVKFLTQPNAQVPDPTVGHAIVSVGGVAYPVTNEAQGVIIGLANSSGATFPIS